MKYEALVKLPIFVILWVAFLMIKIPVNLLALFVVPFMWEYRDVKYDNLPGWMRLWSNLEDWEGQVNSYENSLPRWWVVEHGKGFWAFYQYHAIRNAGDGLRSIEWLDLDVDKDRVRYWTPLFFTSYEPIGTRESGLKTVGYIAWQGLQAGMKIVHIWNDERHFVMKLGWRVEPQDAHTPRGPASLNQNEGFATKFLPYREG